MPGRGTDVTPPKAPWQGPDGRPEHGRGRRNPCDPAKVPPTEGFSQGAMSTPQPESRSARVCFDWSDKAEIERFFQEYYPRSVNQLRASGERDEARRHDIAMDALTGIWLEAPSFVEWSYVQTRLAWEQCHTWQRASERHAPDSLGDAAEEQLAQSPSPQRLAELSETWSWFGEIASEVILLRRVEGLASKEVAAILGISPNAVDQRVHDWTRRYAAPSKGYFGRNAAALPATLLRADGSIHLVPMKGPLTRFDPRQRPGFTSQLEFPAGFEPVAGTRAWLHVVDEAGRLRSSKGFEPEFTRDGELHELRGRPQLPIRVPADGLALVGLWIVERRRAATA